VKRFPLVIGATAAAVAGVLSFRTPASTLPAQAQSGASTGSSTTTRVPPTTAPTTGTGPPKGTSPSSSPTTTTTSPPAPTTTAPAAASATGAAEQYGYGVISVKITASGSHITAATVASLQTAESYSQQLAQQVIPVLRREVLSAQSARITAVSGATYTSQAYIASVQSALDTLHI
jgi:uncharacterized protein with FMN-binding domain